VEFDGKRQRRGHGDRLSSKKWEVLQNRTFYGNDVDTPRWCTSRP
jgi:hypothetical protein